ncbi:hypothetical protein QCA50_019373 [Cerrena zonata]|uniref:ubiquitinyl hydrolase 1 n=1 Tax=Cerrena zonata TaxID=2478898 RepID=A0AAW0FKA1_9APHY
MQADTRDFIDLVYHIFLPPKLPQSAPTEDRKQRLDVLMLQAVLESAEEYAASLSAEEGEQWPPLIEMLKQILRTSEIPLSKTSLYRDLSQLKENGVLALHIRAQNACVIVRKTALETTFETFEVSPKNEPVMSTSGKLRCSYPGHAAAISAPTFSDHFFLTELSSFLAQMDIDVIDDVTPKTKKAGNDVLETRDSTDPRYISQLLVGVIGGLGRVIGVRRIQKRIADEVLWLDAAQPWRRAPLWLIIRVVLQTTLKHRHEYKSFMVFLRSRLVSIAIEHGICSDLLFTMRAKVARAFYKLCESPTPTFVDTTVEAAVKRAGKVLQDRWATIQQQQAASPPWNPLACDIETATTLTLPKSYDFIAKTLQQHGELPVKDFTPTNPSHLGRVSDFIRYSGEKGLSQEFRKHGVVALHSFEDSIQIYIDFWIENNLDNPRACTTLESCFSQYRELAMTQYTSNPEDGSIMVLTLMEIWVALDKISVAQFPLLCEYVPEIPHTFLHPLLFRHSRFISRADEIERYIVERYQNAMDSFGTHSSVFSDTITATSVSVRYFRQSSMLQDLKLDMESQATAQRNSKTNRLKALNEEHEQLVEQSSALEHDDVWKKYSRKLEHNKVDCRKCQLLKKAKKLSITIHEWPLPSDQLEAESVVFELACPAVFSIWRNVTFSMLCTVGTNGSSVDPADSKHDLHSSNLEGWMKEPSYKSITLASTTKQFTGSHYRTVKMPATESAVFRTHGSQWRLYDRDSKTWAANRFMGTSVADYGTYSLSHDSPYAYLQDTLSSTVHTSNEVLAEQVKCPSELTLHEHIAFGTLRSGGRIQWLNVMRELTSNALSFEREEVHELLLQSTCQLGPCSSRNSGSGSVREWHEVLTNPHFLWSLLAILETLLKGVEANWRQVVAVKTIVMIISRVLASQPYGTEISRKAYTILRKARSTTYQWALELEKIIELRTTSQEIQECSQRILIVTTTCRSTYDVDQCHRPAVLNTVTDTRIFIHCAFLINYHILSCQNDVSADVQRSLARDYRLRYHLQDSVAEQIVSTSRGLDEAIQAIWPGFTKNVDARWMPVHASNTHWWKTHVATGAVVHCNIFDGRFLVNGKPLGRLPKSYTRHETYQRIFGNQIIDVIPFAEAPMEFSSRRLFNEHEVSFAFSEGQLLVRASRQVAGGNFEVSEVIPHSILADDLPFPLTHHYVHWLNLGTRVIEFRPLNDVWHANKANFYLDVESRKLTRVQRYETQMVDVYSSLFDMVSTHLRPLEEARHMIITYHPHSTSKRIRVDFPRSHLTFFVNEDGQLESGNTRGYIVDDCQAAGTMFGLTNQLVLRKKHFHAAHTPESRLIVIPFGTVVTKCTDDHVIVHIDTKSLTSVEYHIFTIDDTLGCLSSESGMKSWFYMIYLHAVTSHCLPDPLLKRTGTEEALLALQSARSFSFVEIKRDNLEQLATIAAIAPRRSFYPLHLQSMQSTYWDPSLQSLSQHDAFGILVSCIFSHVKALQVFHGSALADDFELPISSQHLTIRAMHRSLSYYRQDLIDITKAYCHDTIHNDLVNGLWTHCNVFVASCRIVRFSKEDLRTISHFPFPIWNTITSWSTPHSTISSWPPNWEQNSIRTLSYHRAWLADDLRSRWLELHNLCCATNPNHAQWRYQVAFTFGAMVYANLSMEQVALMFLAFIASRAIYILEAPSPLMVYTLADGFEPSRNILRQRLEANQPPCLDPSHKLDQELALDQVVDHLIQQWPEVNLREPGGDAGTWLDITSSIHQANDYFASCRNNKQLRDYFQSLEIALYWGHPPSHMWLESNTNNLIGLLHRQLVEDPIIEDSQSPSPPTLSHLLTYPLPASLPPTTSYQSGSQLHTPYQFSSQLLAPTKLKAVLTRLEAHHHRSSAVCNLYVDDLRRSCEVLEADGSQQAEQIELVSLLHYEEMSAKDCTSLLSQIQTANTPSSAIHGRVLYEAGQWPNICSRTLLQQLNIHSRSTSLPMPNPDWHELLVQFAERILEHQRSKRLLDHYLYGRTDEFANERKNSHVDRAIALREPDWLLVQIEGNFLIRKVQVDIASAMIDPPSEKNTALQLNMGEGKSSVIVPIVAATLANRKQLARVIVLKALSKQMFELLVQRLSHLCDRRIYYIPFSRHLDIGKEEVNLLRGLYQQCMEGGGILVFQPEHILSLKLMAVDRTISAYPNSRELAKVLRETQEWLTRNSRTILDESDEILHVRYQLIYTIGRQEPIQNHSDRWGTIQSVLHRVHGHALQLRSQYPTEIEVHSSPGNFPVIRILSTLVKRKLSHLIASDALNNKIPTLSLAFAPRPLQVKIHRFLVESDLVLSDYDLLKNHFERTGDWANILLLRGLLSGTSGVIHYALSERRWKVDYGHDFQRSCLAVPYQAKDVPSLRSEFGHTDVALTLTCLSYYYAGLTVPQLRQCFDLLYKLDNPELEYSLWVQHRHDIPEALRRLSGVNLDDSEQFDNMLVPLFRNNSSTADFFLCQIVFPQEAKTFPHKLTTTGWDLVEEGENLTTGFSGTNDNRFLLPTSITQFSRAEQLSTNARVLSYLLQPENNTYFCLTGPDQETLTTYEFLRKLTSEYPDIRVLLDVGAQMLQLNNEALVRYWLSLRPDIPAAIFFNEEDELTVVTQQQQQRTEPLYSSSFKQRLDECLVYLDDAHTRGTDLRLPRAARAVVTLGPKVTKDRLVQGCMRMRKLGHSQSLVFCAPPEIDRRLREIRELSPDTKADTTPEVSDIIVWAILETFSETERYIPLWAQQGVDHDRRQKAYSRYFISSGVGALRDAWRQRESKPLEELYGMEVPSFGDTEHLAFQLPEIGDRLNTFGITKLSETGLGEEQEREVSQEVEQEREVERPPKVVPAKPVLHEVVKKFILTGGLDTTSRYIIPAVDLLPSSTAQDTLRRTWATGLYVTRDFTTTITSSRPQEPDFMRPVSWVVSGSSNGTNMVFMILSPHEPPRHRMDEILLRSLFLHDFWCGTVFLSVPVSGNTKSTQSCLRSTIFGQCGSVV